MIQKQTALPLGASVVTAMILFAGCGPAEQGVDPQVLALRAKYVLSQEPGGAMSVVAAKAAVEKGEPVVLVGRISYGEHEPWDEGHAAFYITDAFSPTALPHAHDDAQHEHEGETHVGDDDEGHEHEADEHDADEHGPDERDADKHDADVHETDEHEAGEHEPAEHEGEGHADHAHEAHVAGGHDPSKCKFCSREMKSEDLRAVVEFVDGTGHRLHTDARDLLGVKRDQLVVVRGRGRVESDGYLVVTSDGIYLRN